MDQNLAEPGKLRKGPESTGESKIRQAAKLFLAPPLPHLG